MVLLAFFRSDKQLLQGQIQWVLDPVAPGSTLDVTDVHCFYLCRAQESEFHPLLLQFDEVLVGVAPVQPSLHLRAAFVVCRIELAALLLQTPASALSSIGLCPPAHLWLCLLQSPLLRAALFSGKLQQPVIHFVLFKGGFQQSDIFTARLL